MSRILAIAAAASLMLAVAGPRTRTAIAALHGEFAGLDVLATPAAAAPSRVQPQPNWVAVGDYTAALAREQARKSAR